MILLLIVIIFLLLLLLNKEPFRQLKENDCSICFEELDSENKQIEKICSISPLHRAHISCIKQYLSVNRNATCPICRSALLDTLNNNQENRDISLEEDEDLFRRLRNYYYGRN